MTDFPKPLEFRRIDALARIFRTAPNALVGIGDDAAVLPPSDETQVWTIDAAVQGVHFDRAWLAPYDIGFRAFMAAASDVAAMGAHASHALCALTMPSDLEDEALRGIAHGVEAASERCTCPVVGGNLSRGALLTLTTTVLGHVQGSPLLRSGGRAGQRLYVSGPVGAARVGLEALRRGREAGMMDAFARAFRAPRARLDLSDRLRQVASCAIDLSDGLLADLSHLCRASGVGARIELDQLPRLPEHAQACSALALSELDCLLAGGEEYEILFACAPEVEIDWAHPIGELRPAEEGMRVYRSDGTQHPAPTGFSHFSSQDA